MTTSSLSRARPVRRTGIRRHAGFTLIELLISITIGMVIIGAALAAYLNSAQAGRVANAESRMNEDAQAALDILSQQIRMAGNNPKRPNYTQAVPRNPIANIVSVRGCDGTFTNIKQVGATPAAADVSSLACTDGVGPNSIAVTYEADAFNTAATAAGLPTDCIGNGLTATTASVSQITSPTTTAPSNVTFYEADNRYYIDTSATTSRTGLYCRGNGGAGTPQPMIENIVDLRLTYGTAQPSPNNRQVYGYLTATELNSATGAAAGLIGQTVQARWGLVLAVRVCVIVQSEEILADTISHTYLQCDGTTATTSDRRLRRAFYSTFSLRNRVSAL